jgi:hypothetical protein
MSLIRDLLRGNIVVMAQREQFPSHDIILSRRIYILV